MVRKWVGGAVAVALVAVAGTGWLVVQRQAHVVLEQGVAQFRERLGPGTQFSYASATPSVLHRNARFAGVRIAGRDSTVTADTLVAGCDAASVCSGTAEGVRLDAKGGVEVAWTADHVGWINLAVPPGSGPLDSPGAALDLAQGTRFDAAEVRGAHMTGGTGEMTIAAVGMTGYGTGRRGQGTLDGMTVSIPDPALAAGAATGAGPGPTEGSGPQGMIRLRVGHSAYDGVDVAAIVAALRAGAATPAVQQEQHTSEMADLDVARGEAVLLHVGRLASAGDTLASGAAHGVMDATDVRFGDTEPSLHRLGYERFAGNLHLDGTFDQATGELAIGMLRVVGAGMGQASLSGGFGHVPLVGATLAMPDPAAMLGLTLRGLDLVLVDGGLMQHVLDEKAKEAGTDAGRLRDTVAQQIGAVPMSSDAGKSVRAALVAFVRAPGTLTLGAHPATPLTVADMAQLAGGPDAVIRSLNLTAAAK